MDHDALVERLTSESLRVMARREVEHVEVFHRMSRTQRVTYDGTSDSHSFGSGCEEGVALRLWRARDARVWFAAASGSSRESIERATDRGLAVVGAGLTSPAERCAPGDPLVDHDEATRPDPERLREWLAEARAGLMAAPGISRSPDRAWIEVAATRETWIADGRPVGSRDRTRGWALAQPSVVDGRSAPPLILAERAWERLDPGDWNRMQAWRTGGTGPAAARSKLPLVFSPETSATLVLALVRALPRNGSAIRIRRGFRVRDCPGEPSAVFGGVFDDLGFPTASRVVTDGRGVLGRLEGPGHYRRPSFRDVPVALPSSLIVEPPEGAAPPDRWLAHRLSIHALTVDRWALELEASLWRRGAPCGAPRRITIVSGPLELLGCCTAGIGAAVSSYRGVQTPALLLEGLTVIP